MSSQTSDGPDPYAAEQDDSALCCKNSLLCSQSRCALLILGVLSTCGLYFAKQAQDGIEVSWIIVFMPLAFGILIFMFIPVIILLISFFGSCHSLNPCSTIRARIKSSCCCCFRKPTRIAPILPVLALHNHATTHPTGTHIVKK